MSGAVTPAPVRQQLARGRRRGTIVALAVVAFAAVVLVALVLALSADETHTVSSERPVAVPSGGSPQPAPWGEGIRYDGGPEEGSSGASTTGR